MSDLPTTQGNFRKTILTHLADCWQTVLDEALANQRTTLLSQLREGVEGLRLERGQEIIEAEKHTAPEILWNEIMANDKEIKAYNKVLTLIEKLTKEI